MSDLLIETMHVRARAADPDDAARLRALVEDLTDRRLDEALANDVAGRGTGACAGWTCPCPTSRAPRTP